MAVDTGSIGCSALDVLLQGAGPRPAPSAALSPVCEAVVMSMSLIVGTYYLGQTSWWLNAENYRVVAWAGAGVPGTPDSRWLYRPPALPQDRMPDAQPRPCGPEPRHPVDPRQRSAEIMMRPGTKPSA